MFARRMMLRNFPLLAEVGREGVGRGW